MGFIIEWEQPIPMEEPEHLPETSSTNWAIGFLINNEEAWKNYHDELSYQFEKDVRNWIAYMVQAYPKWGRSAKLRKYKLSMLVKAIWNIDYSVKEHRKYQTRWIDIFRYYSSRITRTWYDPKTGKTRDRTCYCISPARLKRPPLNIKLRIEWMREQGIEPTYRNTDLIKDDLRRGHARNPKVEANCMKRSERGKKIWEDYVAKVNREKYKHNREQRELDAGRVDGCVPDDVLPGENDRAS